MSGSLLGGSAATIPMDVMGGGGPSSPQAGGLGSSLGQIGQLLSVQSALNQQKMFQLQYGARQRAGQIISSAPDLETGLEQARQDPTVAAAPDVLNQFREMQQTLTHTQGMQLDQNINGLQAVLKASSAAINDPSKTRQYFEMALSSLPPEIRARDQDAAQRAYNAITDNGKADGPTIQKNLLGIYGAGQGTPAGLQVMTGISPTQMDLGGRKMLLGQSLLTGGAVGSPSSFGTSLSPQVANVPTASGGTESLVVGGGGGNWAGKPNPLLGGLPNPSEGGAAPPSTAPASNVLGASPGAAQKEYLSHVGTDMADYRKNLNDNVIAGNNIMQSITQARDALQSFRPGGGAGTYQQIAQIAQAFGASDKLVDKISNGNLAATQEMQKLMIGTALGQVKQQMDGQGRITQSEFEQFRKNNPNIDTDPRAIEKIFNFWTQVHNRNVEEQQGLTNYQGPIENWPAEWQKRLQARGYVAPVQTQGGAALPAQEPQGQTKVEGSKPGGYSKADDVVSAYKAGKINRDQAKQLLQSNGWAQ